MVRQDAAGSQPDRARARQRLGHTYLKSFYLDSSRPLGWNNALFANASMPNPLWEMQGLQHAVHGKAEGRHGPAGDRPED